MFVCSFLCSYRVPYTHSRAQQLFDLNSFMNIHDSDEKENTMLSGLKYKNYPLKDLSYVRWLEMVSYKFKIDYYKFHYPC